MTGIATRTIACAGGMPAFVAVPDAAARMPAVIVVHERYGLVRHICDLAERFARDGFVAIAPDLYFQHPDQAALHGLLQKVRDTGLPLVSVTHVDADPTATPGTEPR